MFIHQTLARAARLFGRREALVCGDVRLTYADLDRRVAGLAGALRDAGVRPGDRVAALMYNCHRYMETYFAAERAGAVLVPINYRLAGPEIAAILVDSGARLLLIDAALIPLYAACEPDLPAPLPLVIAPPTTTELSGAATLPKAEDFEESLARAEPMTEPAREWHPDDLVHLYYTSGTTGRAKGVMLSQRNVMGNAVNALLIHRVTGADVYIHAAPMFHLADAWAGWTLSWLGVRHVFMREFHPERFLQLVERERVTLACIVPTMINLMVDLPNAAGYDCSTLRLMSFGASPMPLDRLLAAMRTFPCRFTQLYGMTETAPFATQLQPEEMVTEGPEPLTRRLLSCGREIPGVRVRVVDGEDRDVAPGEAGEIVMQGPTVMLGYWKQPEASALALRGGWMHSGDLAVTDEEGYIFIVDRSKDMIITGGENVYSTEVEGALFAHPAVLEAAVIAVPDDRWGERVHAVVVLREGLIATEEELTTHCRAHIAGYKVPRSYEFAPALPRTGSGKIQKSVLRAPHWGDRQRSVG